MRGILRNATGVFALGMVLFIAFGWLVLDGLIWLLELLSKLK
jgi:hypothetical protein